MKPYDAYLTVYYLVFINRRAPPAQPKTGGSVGSAGSAGQKLSPVGPVPAQASSQFERLAATPVVAKILDSDDEDEDEDLYDDTSVEDPDDKPI